MSTRSKVPARWREYYNDAMRWPAWLNSRAVRWQYQRKGFHPPTPALVNLGAGKDYRRGFINVDVNIRWKRDVWLDLRNPLPFPSRSIDGIFCSHVLEHFPYNETRGIVAECYRSLKTGGILRVAVPDFEPAIQAYINGDRAYFHAEGASLGRLLSEHVLDNSNHRLMFDYGFLEELLQSVGFKTVRRGQYRQSDSPVGQALAELDNRPEITVYAEAIR